VVAGLPAHTSHLKLPLDVGVFGPYKEVFRNLLNNQAIVTNKNTRHDVFTVVELLASAYVKTLTMPNIIGGFKRCVLWTASKNGPDPEKIIPRTLPALAQRILWKATPGLIKRHPVTNSRTVCPSTVNRRHFQLLSSRNRAFVRTESCMRCTRRRQRC
jgi:DDE superfamily endonuclease